jgi:phytoene dehydrogenase-like protein
MAGLKVKVLERRPVVGGAAVTGGVLPGFRNSVAAYTVSLLNPRSIADLRLLRRMAADRRTPRAELSCPPRMGRYLLAAEGIDRTRDCESSAA